MAGLLRDRRLWIFLALIAGFLALRASGAGDLLSLETLTRHRAALTAFVAENILLAAGAYVAVYVLAVAFSVPGAVVLTLAGGFLFGAVPGLLLTLVAATTGATLVFLLARRLFGERALDRFGPRAQRLAEVIRRDAAFYLLALRLVPVFPFFLVNLVPAFAGVGLRVFVPVTFFGILPGTAVTSLTGAGLGGILDEGKDLALASLLRPELIIALCVLAALSLAAIPLRHRLQRP